MSPRHPYAIERPAGQLVELPGVDGPRRAGQPAGRRRRLFPDSSVRLDPVGHRAAEPASSSRPAVFYLHPWEIDPDQPQLKASLLADSATIAIFADRSAAANTARRFCVRAPMRSFSHDPANAPSLDRGAACPSVPLGDAVDYTWRVATAQSVGSRPHRGAVKVSSATSANEWERSSTANPAATGYHLWRWRHVFERAFGHRDGISHRPPPRSRRRRPAARAVPQARLFGRFAVSLPFVNYGGVVADDAGPRPCAA